MFDSVPEIDGTGLENLISKAEDGGAVLKFYSYIMDQEIEFRAFLTSYNDSFNSNWNKESVYGRMDPIYTFQNTQRTMGLSFTIPNVASRANSEGNREIACTMDKINKFFQFLYPKYSGGGNALTISQAPLVRIKFANLIARSVKFAPGTAKEGGILGAISSLSMTPKIEHGFSSMAPDADPLIYPNFIDMQLAFDPIHEQGRFGSSDSALSPGEAQYAEEFGVLDRELWGGTPADNFPYGGWRDICTPINEGSITETRDHLFTSPSPPEGEVEAVSEDAEYEVNG